MPPFDRRLDYRVHYPISMRPCLEMQGIMVTVLDISENGISFQGPGGMVKSGDLISGRVTFDNSSSSSITGIIKWVDEGYGGALLQRGFDFRKIAAEFQRIQGQPE